ncbi:hypothetical protein CEW92_03910 [Bacillaceae bacterium SAS-127]|nr:hypothetical protein CEW92_03910 [Bacillaceae bacterium SAS-127]
MKDFFILTKYQTRSVAKKSFFEYIEFFYNSKKIHSTFCYHTPNEYEKCTVNHRWYRACRPKKFRNGISKLFHFVEKR